MKIFSFDAETNGLWGTPFAIGAVVYEGYEEGVEVNRFLGRCPIKEPVDKWVRENILPVMKDVPVTHTNYSDLLSAFAKFYLANKKIVESKILRDMYERKLIGPWDGPYPLSDLSGNLQQVGEDPTSVDKYIQKYGLKVGDIGSSHNPLYDSEVAARVYIHLLSRVAKGS